MMMTMVTRWRRCCLIALVLPCLYPSNEPICAFSLNSPERIGISRRTKVGLPGNIRRNIDIGARDGDGGASCSSRCVLNTSQQNRRSCNPNTVLSSDIRGGASDGDTAKVDKADDDKVARGISLSLFLTYLTVMGAKCALPSTLAMLTSTNSGLAHRHAVLSRQDVISRLLAFSTLSIAAGKLFLGPVIDSIGGVSSLQIALATLSICLGSIGMGTQTCPTLTSLAMYWIVVDFAFSSCWAACVKTIRDYLPEEKWSREIGRLAMVS